MESTLGIRQSKAAKPSPLEGLPSYQAQRAEAEIAQIERREWWMWFSALTVSILCAAAFTLTAFPSFFRHSDHFYELRLEQARWGILCLMLLFNAWMVYRQWSFRRVRRQAKERTSASAGTSGEVYDPSGMDPVTGLGPARSAREAIGSFEVPVVGR